MKVVDFFKEQGYMVNAVKVFTLRLCISAYYIHFKRVKVKIFTAFTIIFNADGLSEITQHYGRRY